MTIPSCEALGLLKMDFLGLRNLTVLDDALENIEANRGDDLVLEALPLDDPPTYELLSRGDTLGVFQLDGGPMRALLRRMQPDRSRTSRRSSRCTVPARWARTPTTTTRDRKNGRKPSGRSTPSSPSRWPRSWARPTA